MLDVDIKTVCAYCLALHGDDGQWIPFAERPSVPWGSPVSHGVCPECFDSVARPVLEASGELRSPFDVGVGTPEGPDEDR